MFFYRPIYFSLYGILTVPMNANDVLHSFTSFPKLQALTLIALHLSQK